MTWNYHVDEFDKGRHYMTLGRDILKILGLNLKFSNHIIESDNGPHKGYTVTWLIYISIHLNI